MPEGIDLHEVLSGDAQAWANAGSAIIIGLIIVSGWLKTKRANAGSRATISVSDIDKKFTNILDVLNRIVKILERGRHDADIDRAYRKGLYESELRRRSALPPRNLRVSDDGEMGEET